MNGKDYIRRKNISKNGIGCKWIDEYTDLYIAIKEILNKKMTISQYLNTMTGNKIFGSLSFDDPLPFIAETLMIPLLSQR